MKALLSLLTSLVLIFNPVSSLAVSAAPAVVAAAGEAIYGLLVALGLVVGNESGEYVWNANYDNPYVTSIFEEQVEGITSGIPISDKMLGEVETKILPEDVYTTDGSKYYVSGKEISTADLFVKAKALLGVKYGLPTNVYSASAYTGLSVGSDHGWYSPVGTSDINNGNCFIPCYGYNGHLLYQKFGLAIFPDKLRLYDFTGNNLSGSLGSGGSGIPKYISTGTRSYVPYILSTDNPSINGNYRASTMSWGGTVAYDENGKSYNLSNIWNDLDYSTFVVTNGIPVDTVNGDTSSLDGAIVQVKPTKKDEDNNGSTPPVVPQSPNTWEIWQTVDELFDEIIEGTNTNHGTTFQDYVNNNYNYVAVDVDVNMPDRVDVGLSGGLDINGKGDINVNIHEELPSVSSGDGSGFFDADAVDVIAALTTNNPVVHVIKGLFEAIDPSLLAIFSVGVSLLIVLGLWKLIRG